MRATRRMRRLRQESLNTRYHRARMRGFWLGRPTIRFMKVRREFGGWLYADPRALEKLRFAVVDEGPYFANSIKDMGVSAPMP